MPEDTMGNERLLNHGVITNRSPISATVKRPHEPSTLC